MHDDQCSTLNIHTQKSKRGEKNGTTQLSKDRNKIRWDGNSVAEC